MPKVSIIIPAYNCAPYITDAMKSVLNQTYKDYEIIVVDDGSTDNTREIMEEYIKKYSEKIRYLYQENKGVCAARNKGIKEAEGKYLAFLDQDDIWLREFLQKMVEKIEQGFDWVVCDNYKEYIYVDTGHVEKLIEKREMNDKWTSVKLLKEFLVRDRIGGPSKIMVRKKVLIENNIFFDIRLNGLEDWDFYLELLKKECSLGWVKEPLYVYRIRNDNSNLTRKLGLKYLSLELILLEKHKDTFVKFDMESCLGDHYFALARKFWKENQDVMKFTWCILRNVQYKGIIDIFLLFKRKVQLSRKTD